MEEDKEDEIEFKIPKVVNQIVPLLTIIFFIMAIYFVSFQVEKIGYYHACEDMNLSMVYQDGGRFCGDLEKINADNQALRDEVSEDWRVEMQRQTRELMRQLGNMTEVK